MGLRWRRFAVSGILLTTCGCSIHPYREVLVEHRWLKEKKGRESADANHITIGPLCISLKPDNPPVCDTGAPDDNRRNVLSITHEASIHLVNTREVTYRWTDHPLRAPLVVIDGTFAEGAPCKLVIDTGAAPALLVRGSHILQNGFDFLPDSRDLNVGLCYIPELHVGNMSVKDVLAWYSDYELQRQIFGIGLAYEQTTHALMGLPLLLSFQHVRFDFVRHDVTLARTPFRPATAAGWMKFPCSVQERGGGPSLILRLPIGGREYELLVDTGSTYALIVTQHLWAQWSAHVRCTRQHRAHIWLPEHGGRHECWKGRIDRLPMGRHHPRNVEVCIVADDDRIRESDGVIGLPLFKEAEALVLDFDRGLLWIR
jgi:hypothetical protein